MTTLLLPKPDCVKPWGLYRTGRPSETPPLAGRRLVGGPRTPDDETEKKFLALAILWKYGRGPTSSIREIVMHPAYQRIIGMGPPVVQLILRELEREVDHWFSALQAITGQDPVAPDSRGDLEQMRASWLAWGRQHGYLRSNGS